jgi:hypothetical protein
MLGVVSVGDGQRGRLTGSARVTWKEKLSQLGQPDHRSGRPGFGSQNPTFPRTVHRVERAVVGYRASATTT